MRTGGRPEGGVCAAVDVHYQEHRRRPGGSLLAADAVFAHVLAEPAAVLSRAAPCRPGQFYPRELPPLCAVLADLSGLGLLVTSGHADLDRPARPGPAWARMRTPSPASR
jgi:deoxyribonuclease V